LPDDQKICQNATELSSGPSNQRIPLPGSTHDAHPNLGVLLREPVQEIVRRVSAGLAAAGFDDLRPAHTAVFQHIDADGSRLTDLADRAQITKQSMSYLVDYLEERGYLERRRDSTDRRATLICLTERGWNQIRTALAIIDAVEKEWSRKIGTQRMQQLRTTLSELRSLTDTNLRPAKH
jgi:DNA-binding MarR family transcriptional regulator